MLSNKIIKIPTITRNQTYCPRVPWTVQLLLLLWGKKTWTKFERAIEDHQSNDKKWDMCRTSMRLNKPPTLRWRFWQQPDLATCKAVNNRRFSHPPKEIWVLSAMESFYASHGCTGGGSLINRVWRKGLFMVVVGILAIIFDNMLTVKIL